MPVDDNGNYECALSGVRSEPGDYDDSDGLEDIPLGWIQVSFKRRLVNPEWQLLAEAQQEMIEATLASLPPGLPDAFKERQSKIISLQVKAQFKQLRQDTPRFVVLEEVAVIAPPEENEDLLEAVNNMRSDLGLAPMEMLTAGNDEEENSDDSDKEDETE